MKSSSQVPFTQHLFETYEKYTAADITTNRISHASVMSHIDRFTESLNGIMTVEDLGRSAEGRAIKLLKLGAGSTTVFMWSQMHGDEPTATMALIDMLSYIRDNRETPEVKSILAGVTILILPMLNPDGAERFQRRTALGIDMNRDAARLQTPEAQILKNTRDRYNPQIGFNLHDMDTRFTVGTSDKVAAIALLAPAFDDAKTDNPVRARAKKVAATLADVFTQYLEGHISRYDDSYDPRAFGDRVQGWGTSTVLIESGGWKNDPRKMFLRKVNCVAYLSVLQAIATGSYESSDVARYETLNEHRRGLYDMIVEKVTLKFEHDMPSVVADLGIDISEILHAGAIRTEARIMDIGDLSPFHAFERVNAEGMAIDASTMKLESIVDLDKLRSLIGK